MPAYAPEPESTTGRGQGRLAVAFVILALATSYLPEGAQQTIAGALRVSVLRPFVATQERLGNARLRASQVDALQSQLDSLTVILATQGALAHENETLRDLLALEQRTGPSFVPATIIRPGTPGSESMFLIELGSDHGIRAGAPVVGLHGVDHDVAERKKRKEARLRGF